MSIEFMSENTPQPEISEENTETTPVPQGENAEPIDNGTVLQPEIPEPEKRAPEKPVIKSRARVEKPNRLSITVNFNGEEGEYVQQIIDARIKSGISTNQGHFIRQCVDFAIHYNQLHKNFSSISFAVPDIDRVKIKDGFFKD